MSYDSIKNPQGRLDVLAYKVSEKVIQELESYWGCQGLWDICKEHVESGIRDIGLKKVPEPLLNVAAKLLEAKRSYDGKK
jgi:hypothetical protein